MLLRVFILVLLAALGAGPSWAANKLQVPQTVDPQLNECLKKADQLPDIAEADAEAWLKRGGGEAARMCQAVAQFNRNEFAAAGQEFAIIASLHDANDAKHAAEMHAQAGLSYMRADDNKDAELQYAAALRLEPDDPEIWIDRAAERAGAEHYWDAIDDLSHALKIMPDDVEALRMRGQCWMKLNNLKNAESDFEHAEDIEGLTVMPSVPTGTSASTPVPISTAKAAPSK